MGRDVSIPIARLVEGGLPAICPITGATDDVVWAPVTFAYVPTPEDTSNEAYLALAHLNVGAVAAFAVAQGVASVVESVGRRLVVRGVLPVERLALHAWETRRLLWLLLPSLAMSGVAGVLAHQLGHAVEVAGGALVAIAIVARAWWTAPRGLGLSCPFIDERGFLILTIPSDAAATAYEGALEIVALPSSAPPAKAASAPRGPAAPRFRDETCSACGKKQRTRTGAVFVCDACGARLDG